MRLRVGVAASLWVLSGLGEVRAQTASEGVRDPAAAPGESRGEPRQTIVVTYVAPQDEDRYYAAVTGDDDARALRSMKLILKTKRVPATRDVIRASAQAAAEELPAGGGPPHASVAYLKIRGKTAYVLLDIDRDGWAGAWASQLRIHPLVEKTLLRFKGIRRVVFSEAPGDKALEPGESVSP